MHGLSEHAVFLFLTQFAILLAAARLLGAVAHKFNQPTVLGELLAGVLLGPAVFGHLWPAGHAAVFPPDQLQEHLLEMLSWLGMILLILRTGLEVDLRLWRFLGRAALLTSVFGIVLPYAAGFGIGKWMPAELLVPHGDRTVFALFLATTMSISAVKVIAKTLLDLKLMRRDIGAIILAASITDDTVGWVLLSIVSSIAVSGSVSIANVSHPILATAAVVGGAWFFGRRIVREVIGRIERGERLEHATVSAILVLTLCFAALTQRLGIHAAFGAFIAGVLITDSPRVRQTTLDALDSVILGVFAPIFFVYTGLKVSTLALPPVQITLLIVVGALLAKTVGAGLGARLGGLGFGSALAIGIGMSSRGSMELIVARIGMDLGVLTPAIYAAIVLIPIVTSLTTPVLLKLAIRAVKPEARETQRLAQEAEQENAVLAKDGAKVLVALSDGPRSYQAMRMASTVARLPGATLVAVSVIPSEPPTRLQRRTALTEQWVRAVIERFTAEEPLPDFHTKTEAALSPVEAISEELGRGYDLVFVGAGRRRTVSNRLLTAAQEKGVHTVVLSGDDFPRHFRRILLATAGGIAARGACELALLYAKATGAQVQAINVIDAAARNITGGSQLRAVAGQLLGEVERLGEQQGVRPEKLVRVSSLPARSILAAAEDGDADLILLGANPRVLGRRLFLGNTVEHVLAHAPCSVALFVPAPAKT